MAEQCILCGCRLHRKKGTYAKPTVDGRSHATKHHYVAERFFGRSTNKSKEQRKPIFKKDPWNMEHRTAVYCYECHELLLHNPVLLPEDIKKFAALVRQRKFNEDEKKASKNKLAGRIKLLHEVLKRGIEETLKDKEKGGV